jgi:hypothetical protein
MAGDGISVNTSSAGWPPARPSINSIHALIFVDDSQVSGEEQDASTGAGVVTAI